MSYKYLKFRLAEWSGTGLPRKMFVHYTTYFIYYEVGLSRSMIIKISSLHRDITLWEKPT